MRHTFLGVDGQHHRCVFPEGRDPLLADSRRGVRDPHDNWLNPEFWERVEQACQQPDPIREMIREAAKIAARRKAKKESEST